MMAHTAYERRDTIAHAISDELDRQSRTGASRIDIDAMAAAIENRIEGQQRMSGRAEMRQARRPDQLNATNDV